MANSGGGGQCRIEIKQLMRTIWIVESVYNHVAVIVATCMAGVDATEEKGEGPRGPRVHFQPGTESPVTPSPRRLVQMPSFFELVRENVESKTSSINVQISVFFFFLSLHWSDKTVLEA